MDDEAFVAAGKEMAKFLVAWVETDSVGAQQPLHSRHQIGLGRFDDEMKVVGHQAIGVHLPAGFLARFGQRLEEAVAVMVVSKMLSRRSP
jgi:hypothetical protein